MEKIPRFTIIVNVVHSQKDLDICLSSLDKLDYPKDRYRVAVVECGAAPGLDRFLAEKGYFDVFDLHLFVLPPETGRPGSNLDKFIRINEARNQVIKSLPSDCYVFTEDDCTFTPAWLKKIETHLDRRPGILGGPDILPGKMDRFTQIVDVILNSWMGSGGMRSGEKGPSKQYVPHKENMVIPSSVLEAVGPFPENNVFGGEMEMADRIQKAGYDVAYMDDNPVFHRRISSLPIFIGMTRYRTTEKTALLGDRISFLRTLRYVIPGTVAFIAALLLMAPFFPWARIFLALLALVYLGGLTVLSFRGAVRKKSVLVGLGVFFILPLYHLSIITGVLSGMLKKRITG